MVKKLIWTCRECGAERFSQKIQDDIVFKDGERNFTCEKCLMKSVGKNKKGRGIQLTMF